MIVMLAVQLTFIRLLDNPGRCQSFFREKYDLFTNYFLMEIINVRFLEVELPVKELC